MSIFPFTLYCDDRHGGGPHEFRATFTEVRPFDRTCYCYDVVIHSPTRVEFVAFDMLDMCSGGKGEKCFTCEAVVDVSLTKRFIDREIMFEAALRREAEIRRSEAAIIEQHAAQIRAELGLTA